MIEIIAHDVKTRYGIIPAIVRTGDTLAFKFGADLAGTYSRREQNWARRAAVAWMAANPALHKGIIEYRFDVGDVINAF